MLVLPPLDIHNPEKNLKFLELHMYQNALEQQKILGDIWIKNALSVLSSVFSLPEMLDCYDNDILFTFRGLLNERAGANIRNEIAHGIMDEYTCSTGACLYFGVAVIKLLSLTSHSCYQIFKNSEKLKHFEMPSKDAFKVIR